MDKTNDNTIYDDIKFFVRNYNEIQEFVAYFNSHLDSFKKDVEPISEETAKIILESLQVDRRGSLNSRQVRLGLDKNDNSLILFEKKKKDIQTVKIDLPQLVSRAYETIEKEKLEGEKVLDSLQHSKVLIAPFGNLFQALQENNIELISKMQTICNTYLGTSFEKQITEEHTQEPLKIGDRIENSTVSKIQDISNGIYKVSFDDEKVKDIVVFDNFIVSKINPILKPFLKIEGDKNFIYAESYISPHVMGDLIKKNLYVVDDEHYKKIQRKIENNPLAYIVVYPVTKENYKERFKELYELAKNSNNDTIEISKKLFSIADPVEREKISKWFTKDLGIDNEITMKKTFEMWLSEKSLNKEIKKLKGEPSIM